MSELTLFKGGLPSYLRDAGVDDVTSTLAGERQLSRRISIKGGVFRELINGKEYRVSEDRSMNVVIIKAAPNTSRIFYAGNYVEGEAVKPTCWSADGQRPDEGVKEKQAATCLNCPQNIKGSGQNDSRACRYQQRLAVMVEGEIDKEEVYQLVLPATSIFGDGEKGRLPLQAYARFLRDGGAPMSGVVTEMRFDVSGTVSGQKLIFKPVRAVTEAEYDVISRMKDSPEAGRAVGSTVAQTDGVTAEYKAPAKVAIPAPQPAPQPAPKPTPVVEVVEAEEVEEDIAPPVKAAPKKAAPVASEPSLEDLVGEWDD